MKIEIEKPIIPYFVAEWIEIEKRCTPFHKLFIRAMVKMYHDNEWENWKHKLGNDWSGILAAAWLYGYKVEEEPKYRAKIKGYELITDERGIMYWMIDKQHGSLLVSDLHLSNFAMLASGYEYITALTKEEWDKLGINDTNADFEKVEKTKND